MQPLSCVVVGARLLGCVLRCADPAAAQATSGRAAALEQLSGMAHRVRCLCRTDTLPHALTLAMLPLLMANPCRPRAAVVGGAGHPGGASGRWGLCSCDAVAFNSVQDGMLLLVCEALGRSAWRGVSVSVCSVALHCASSCFYNMSFSKHLEGAEFSAPLKSVRPRSSSPGFRPLHAAIAQQHNLRGAAACCATHGSLGWRVHLHHTRTCGRRAARHLNSSSEQAGPACCS